MAKLYFKHGAVSSAKTLNLLAAAHAYEVQGKKVLVIKPAMDTRFGADKVKSRAGLDRSADILVNPDTVFEKGTFSGTDCVLVDEAQFVAPAVVEQLRVVASVEGVPVICYGLRTDFRSRLFPASQRLMELADVIEEVKTTCSFCNRRAILNLKSVDGAPTLAGPTVCLGCEELYVPACYRHFVEKIEGATGQPIDFARAAAEGAEADAQQAGRAATSAEASTEAAASAEARTEDKIEAGGKAGATGESRRREPSADAEPHCEPTPEKRPRAVA